jgi:hypothetical protein
VNSFFNHLIILGVLLTAFSCTGESKGRTISSAVAPFDPNTTPVRWTSGAISSGLNVKISTSFTDDFVAGDLDADGKNPMEQMMNAWNASTTNYTFFNTSGLTTTNKDYTSLSSFKSDGEFGIYKSTDWFSNVSSSALAITQYFGYRRNAGSSSEYVELYHADIIVNYKNHSFTLDASDNSSYDLPTVILHELGHFIGLGHESDNSTNAIMLPYLGRSESKRTLVTKDVDNIRGLYNVSTLSAGHFALKSKNVFTDQEPDEEIRGVIELRANGKCHHYINQKLTHIH